MEYGAYETTAHLEPLTNADIIRDRRFRLAVQKGEYSRAITVFLQLKFPGKSFDELAKLSKDDIMNAQVWVDNAFTEKWQREKELAKEMR